MAELELLQFHVGWLCHTLRLMQNGEATAVAQGLHSVICSRLEHHEERLAQEQDVEQFLRDEKLRQYARD